MAQAIPGSDYTVQQGDTLFSIAQQAYGDGNQWPIIANANGISNPNVITPGQVLYIPVLTPTPGFAYNVQQGDTLFSIAQQAYGDGNRWQVIANANSIPNSGQVLYIPTIGPTINCTVTSADGLNTRVAPTSKSTLIKSFSRGTVLSYFETVNGENVSGNALWGHSHQGYYFWLGATDHPNG